MALVPVEIVNNSGAVVRVALEDDGETLEYYRKLVRRDDLASVKVLTTGRKTPAASK